MIHPVVCNPAISPIVGVLDPTAWRAGSSYPSGLLKLYRSTDGQKAALGPITWDGTPVITADGVAAGHGPDMGSVNRAARKVVIPRLRATKASDGIAGDEQVYGPLYFRNGYLVGKLDGEEGTLAASWGVGDEIEALVDMAPSGAIMTRVAEPYIHLSIDDVCGMLVDAQAETSIWDDSRMAFLKSMHDTYGAVFTLNLYYTDGEYNLGQLNNSHASEYLAASSWLKFAFHAQSVASNYSSTAASVAGAQYSAVTNAIGVFAGASMIDHVIRTHGYTGGLDAVGAWLELGVKGFLSADDTRTSYYHSEAQRASLIANDRLQDFTVGTTFWRTDMRLENETDAAAVKAALSSLAASSGQKREHIVFIHEPRLAEQDSLDKIEAACEWANDNSIQFGWAEDRL